MIVSIGVVCWAVVVAGCRGEAVDAVFQVLDHGVTGQRTDHGGSVKVREEQVLGGSVFHHVPALKGEIVWVFLNLLLTSNDILSLNANN